METIIAALIGTGGLLGSAWVQSHRHKRVEKAIGEVSGSSIVQRLEALNAWAERHEGRHDLLERGLAGGPSVKGVILKKRASR